jgi:hypothetical protein
LNPYCPRASTRSAGQHAADAGAAAEQEGRLPTDDLEVLFLRHVGIAVLGQLVQLTLNHPQGDVTQEADDVQFIVRQREGHRLDVQVVAEQDRDVVPPPGVDGEPPAPERGIVDDVVVDEGRRVNELDHRGVQHGTIAGVPAQSRRHQEDGRSNPLSAAGLDVLADPGNQFDL